MWPRINNVYFKSNKEHNYDRFVDLNILGAMHLLPYESIKFRSFFLTEHNSFVQAMFFYYSCIPQKVMKLYPRCRFTVQGGY